MPTRRGKQVVLASTLVLAACAAAFAFLPSMETLAAPYRGVARIQLPNFTRVEMPGSEQAALVETEAQVQGGPPDEAPALALEETRTQHGATAEPRPAATARPAPGNVIPVRFDLETPGLGDEVVGGDEIVVRKAVRLGSREIGSLPIHVDSQSRLLVRPADLKSLLDKAGQGAKVRGAAGSNELRSFGELRKDGVDLRYDPTSDSVIVTIG
ncbi:MAG: hypothetical protein R3E14_08615 [Erythrobacter sp.]